MFVCHACAAHSALRVCTCRFVNWNRARYQLLLRWFLIDDCDHDRSRKQIVLDRQLGEITIGCQFHDQRSALSRGAPKVIIQRSCRARFRDHLQGVRMDPCRNHAGTGAFRHKRGFRKTEKRPSGSVRSEKNSQSVKYSTAIKPPPNGYWCGGGGMRRPVRGCLRNQSRRGRCHLPHPQPHLPHRSRRMSRADGKGRGHRMCRT